MSPVSNTYIVTSVLPQGVPVEQDSAIILNACGNSIASAVTGANPGTVLTKRFNRTTAVNHTASGVISVTPTVGQLGTGYVVGDYLHVTQSSAYGCTLRVDSITVGTGAIKTVSVAYRGTGYSAATGKATSTNSVSGAGAQVDIVSVGGDSVSLPTALAGMELVVRNDAPTSGIALAVFSAGVAGTGYLVGDKVGVTRSGGSGAVLRVAMITRASGAVTFLAVESAGTGYANDTGLVAPIISSANGAAMTVDITIGANPLYVYPATGEYINVAAASGAANAAYSLAAGKELVLRCFVAGTWSAALSN